MLGSKLYILSRSREVQLKSMNKPCKQMGPVCTNTNVYKNGDQGWYKRKVEDRALGLGKVSFQGGKISIVRYGMTYVLDSTNKIVRKGCEFNKKKVCGEQVTTFDAEAAKTKAPNKKVTIKVDPKSIINDGKETTSRDEVDNPERLVVDQENEPLETLADFKQETLLSDRNAEESNSPDVASNLSTEAKMRQFSELVESTVVTKGWKIQQKEDYVIKLDDNYETNEKRSAEILIIISMSVERIV